MKSKNPFRERICVSHLKNIIPFAFGAWPKTRPILNPCLRLSNSWCLPQASSLVGSVPCRGPKADELLTPAGCSAECRLRRTFCGFQQAPLDSWRIPPANTEGMQECKPRKHGTPSLGSEKMSVGQGKEKQPSWKTHNTPRSQMD